MFVGYEIVPANDLILNTLSQSVTNGRGGKGTVYVWAGGNGNLSMLFSLLFYQ